MRCFVTGSTGFIGSHLIRLLLEGDCHVGALIRPNSNPWRIRDVLTRLHIISGDLTEVDRVAPIIREFDPDIIFHLGWQGVNNRFWDDPAQVSSNLYGSLKLLKIARDVNCKCWVGLGSQAEYGPHDGVLAEDLPTQPKTVYGVTKLCVGLLSSKLCEVYDIRFVWLRLLATYGAMDDPVHLIPYVIQCLLRGQKPVLTSGEQRWDYLYVTDAARAIWQSATCPTVQGTLNLCSGESVSVRSIVQRLRDLIDPELPLGLGEIPYNPDQSMNLEADGSLLRQITGWAPQVSLDEGLRMTVTWYRNCA
jgi:UDP-glucose 4-epimerase